MISVFIVDDHPSIIYGVESMLGHQHEIAIAGAFSSGNALLEGLSVNIPDVLLLDIHLPDITGNQLLRIVARQYPQIRILAFTNMNTDFHLKDMLQYGCLGYLLKTADKATLINAIRTVYTGGRFLMSPLSVDMKNQMMQAGKQVRSLPKLSRREQEVLALICSGHTNQQIAGRLFLSLRTVENHRFNLQQKLKVKNAAELVKLSLQLGLTE